MNPEELKLIQELLQQGMAVRAIAKKLGRDPKTLRRALGRSGPSRPPSKLEPFQEMIRERADKGLTATRILREIRERGYSGSLTILKDSLRTIRGPRQSRRKVFRRFETPPAEEAQVDWSPYRLLIAGKETVAHCFSMVAAYSRMMFIAFYRNERLPTLLHAHVEAFGFFGGVFRKNLYDNQTAVTLGRLRGAPLWNPTFLEFSRHHGFEPVVCRPRDPNRRGKGERPFLWIYQELIQANEFSSWEDLNTQARRWLEGVANVRVHATTKRVPREVFEREEKPLLIELPEAAYPTDRREVRKVQTDGYVAVDGSFYPVPAKLVGQHVSVRLYPDRVEILDASGAVAARHAIPDTPGRVPAEGQAFRAPKPSFSLTALETRFLGRFPEAQDFLEGLKRRMNALVPIHLRKIEKLAQLYGPTEVDRAIRRAREYCNFSAVCLERILARWHPDVVEAAEAQPLKPDPAALGALDDVESGSPQEYTLDSENPTRPDTQEDTHGTNQEPR